MLSTDKKKAPRLTAVCQCAAAETLSGVSFNLSPYWLLASEPILQITLKVIHGLAPGLISFPSNSLQAGLHP